MGNVCSSKSKKGGPRKLTLAIVGLDNAGKTVTTKGLQGETLETVAPTVGFSSAEFVFNGQHITLFDLGGGRRIRDIWKNYFAEIYGLIYVIDSSEPERMVECQDNLSTVLGHEQISGKPVLILGNKQDQAGALDELEICDQLNLEKLVNFHKCPCRVETCTAIAGQGKKLDKSIRAGMSWLLQTISNMQDKLTLRVEKDVADLKEKQARDKEERRRQAAKNREERDRLAEKNGERNGSDGEDEVDSNPFKRLDAKELMKKDERLRLDKRRQKQEQSNLSPRLARSRRGSDPEEYSSPRHKPSPPRITKRYDSESEEQSEENSEEESDGDETPPQPAIRSRKSQGETHSKPNRLKPLGGGAKNNGYGRMPLGPSPRLNTRKAANRFYNDGDDDDDNEDNTNSDEDIREPSRNNKSPWSNDRSLRPYDLKPAPSLSVSPRLGARGLGAGEEEAENRGVYGRRPLIPLAPLEPLDGGDALRRKKKKKAKKNQTSPLGVDDDNDLADYKPKVSPFAPRGWGTPPGQRSMMKASLTPRLETLKEPDSERSDTENMNSFSNKWGLVDELPELPSTNHRYMRPNSEYDDDMIT